MSDDTELVALMAAMFSAGVIATRQGYTDEDKEWSIRRARELLVMVRGALAEKSAR